MKKTIYLSFIFAFLIIDVFAQKNIRVTINSGHTKEIKCIKYSPDGTFFASAGSDATIILWDVKTALPIKTLVGHSESIMDLAFSKDGRYIVSGANDNMKIWDVSSGKILWEKKGIRGLFYGVDISPDGTKVAAVASASSNNKTLMVLNFSDGRQVFSKYIGDYSVLDFKYSDDGTKIFIDCSELYKYKNKILKTWNAEDGEQLDNRYASIEKKIKEKASKIIEILKDSYNSISISPDEKYLLSVGNDKIIKQWDIKTGKEIRTFGGLTFPIEDIAIHPKGRYIARAADKSNKVVVWDLFLGNIHYSFDTQHQSQFKGIDGLNSIVFSKDGKYIYTSGYKEIKIWDFETGSFSGSLKDGDKNAHENYIYKLALSSNGELLASSSGDDKVKIWSLKNRKLFTTLEGHTGMITKLAWHPSDDILVSSGWDGKIIFWKISKNKAIKTIESERMINTLAYSSDGKQILYSGLVDYRLKILEGTSGKNKGTIEGSNNNFRCNIFSPDNTLIFASTYTHQIKIFNVSEKKEVLSVQAHNKEIYDMEFTPDGRYLISCSNDGTVKVWNPKTLELILTMASLGLGSDFVTFTSDNKYRVSKAGVRGVGFSLNNSAYPFEQFDLKFNRPDIIVDKLGYVDKSLVNSYKGAYLKRLQKMNFEEEMIAGEIQLPYLSLSDIPYTSTSQKSIAFKLEAKDIKYKLDRINVYVNDIPIYGVQGITLRNNNVSEVKKEIKLELSRGNNKVQVSVHNSQGIESLKQTFNVNYSGSQSSKNLYVVAIGISDYKNGDFDLTYAAKDAKDLVAAFKNNTSDYTSIKVMEFTDANATKEKILKAKATLMQSKVDDEVVLFAAGHGLLDEKLDYYFGTYDVDFHNPSVSGLKYEDLEGLLDGIPARRKLMLLDACHSGEIDKDGEEIPESVQTLATAKNVESGTVKFRGFKNNKNSGKSLGLQNSFELMKELFADLRRGTGEMVISSASGAEFAFESPEWNNGVFTYAILEGLKTGKADDDKNRKIKVSELRDYVSKRVKELTNGRQHPTSRRVNLEFDFDVW